MSRVGDERLITGCMTGESCPLMYQNAPGAGLASLARDDGKAASGSEPICV